MNGITLLEKKKPWNKFDFFLLLLEAELIITGGVAQWSSRPPQEWKISGSNPGKV
jgi:hypothetical protein